MVRHANCPMCAINQLYSWKHKWNKYNTCWYLGKLDVPCTNDSVCSNIYIWVLTCLCVHTVCWRGILPICLQIRTGSISSIRELLLWPLVTITHTLTVCICMRPLNEARSCIANFRSPQWWQRGVWVSCRRWTIGVTRGQLMYHICFPHAQG